MTIKYNLFDSVKLKEAIPLTDEGMVEAGTVGAIVEVFNEGEAYLVELFGGWVKYDEPENFVPAASQEQEAFRETIGIETVYPQQLELVQPAREIVKQVIQKYAQLRPSHGDIRLDTVFDETQSRYALMQVGWDRGRRVRGNLIYITFLDGLVWIEYDGMESSIAQDFVTLGIPEEQIVFAYLPEQQVALTK